MGPNVSLSSRYDSVDSCRAKRKKDAAREDLATMRLPPCTATAAMDVYNAELG